MSGPGDRDRMSGDDGMRVYARQIAVWTLEIERGLRPRDQLRRLTDVKDPDIWNERINIGNFSGGPVPDTDVKTPRLSRTSRDEIIVNVTTKTTAERSGALTFKLSHRNGTWRLVDMERVRARGEYRSGPDADPRQGLPPEVRYRRASSERDLVDGALAAITRQQPVASAARQPQLKGAAQALTNRRGALSLEIKALDEQRTIHASFARR